jgi:acyl-CoA thioesterase I
MRRRTWLGTLPVGFLVGPAGLAALAGRVGRSLWVGAALAGGAPLLAGCGRSRVVTGQPVPAGAPVLALGDSLTAGTGARPEQAWPAELARQTPWQVHNAGVPGDTAERALQRLPALLRAHRPALVIISIGGNDFLRHIEEARTRDAIRAQCALAVDAGAQVLLVGVPRPTLSAALTRVLDDHPLYAELATEMRLPLHRGGWAEVLSDPRLRADRIHANAEGQRRFAQGLLSTLRAAQLLPSS